MSIASPEIEVEIAPLGLKGFLGIPKGAHGLVLFAHGSGSGRFSPRNRQVAAALRRAGFVTLLFDLLAPAEENDRANVFDIRLLATRMVAAVKWARARPELARLPTGLFGASTGAGAALAAAAALGPVIRAIVSRGGRPDLAGPALARVAAPTLLIVGGRDSTVLELNEQAAGRLGGPSRVVTVPGATHLFEEPGALDTVIRLATDWFGAHLRERAGADIGHVDVA
ncbi:MAG TPA: dienelactone hydrolase family protein [Allosphingosinicella sp.]|nr:dienelactone hydrolase family protein [Allosphingosinicella sp.]